jgi:hypothetical protein
MLFSFIVMATVITIINYDHIVITIVNFDPKTFIVQATGVVVCLRIPMVQSSTTIMDIWIDK